MGIHTLQKERHPVTETTCNKDISTLSVCSGSKRHPPNAGLAVVGQCILQTWLDLKINNRLHKYHTIVMIHTSYLTQWAPALWPIPLFNLIGPTVSKLIQYSAKKIFNRVQCSYTPIFYTWGNLTGNIFSIGCQEENLRALWRVQFGSVLTMTQLDQGNGPWSVPPKKYKSATWYSKAKYDH